MKLCGSGRTNQPLVGLFRRHYLEAGEKAYRNDKTKRPRKPCKHKASRVLLMVRLTGLEPVRRETHAPQTCLSTSSSTSAFLAARIVYSLWDDLSILFCAFQKKISIPGTGRMAACPGDPITLSGKGDIPLGHAGILTPAPPQAGPPDRSPRTIRRRCEGQTLSSGPQ